MRLIISDYSKTVDVGTGAIWYSLYSTVKTRVSDTVIKSAPEALYFLKTGECTEKDLASTVKQMALICEALSEVKPEDAVMDYLNPSKDLPWKGRISKDVTSCANLFTTSDGKDLLSEIMGLLIEAARVNLPVMVG